MIEEQVGTRVRGLEKSNSRSRISRFWIQSFGEKMAQEEVYTNEEAYTIFEEEICSMTQKSWNHRRIPWNIYV